MYNYLIAVLIAVVVVAGTVFWTHRDQLAAAQTDPDTQKLLEQLKSSDRNERVEALIQLGKSDDDLDRIVPAIIEMLPDNDTVVQAAASQALQDLGAKAVPYLKPYLESEDPAKYSYGCEAIRLIGEPAKEYLPLLIQQLQGEDTRRDRSSVGALRGLGEHGLPALDEVIKRLDSSNFHVQYEACRAIAAMGPKAAKAGPRLVEMVRDGIPSTRSNAMLALGAIGPQPDYDVVKILNEKLSAFLLIDKQRALEALAMIGPEAQDALPEIERLMNDKSKSAQHYAAYAWWRITGDDKRAVDLLKKLLSSLDFRNEAIEMLSRMGPAAKDAVDDLLKLVNSEDVFVQESAVLALAEIGDARPEVMTALEEVANHGTDPLLREAARRAIRKLNESNGGSEAEQDDD